MTEQLEQELEQEDPQGDWEDEVVHSIEELRSSPETEEPLEEVTSTDTPEEEPSEEPPLAQAPDDEELAQARRIRDVLANNPDLAEAVVRIERGEAVAIPREVLDAARRFQESQQAPPEPVEDPSDRFYSDPANYVSQLEERIARFEQAQQQTYQHRVLQEREQNTTLMVSTGEKWQSSHPELTEDQVRQVIGTVAETGLISRFLKKTGNKEKAIHEALEAAARIEFPQLATQARTDQAIREANRKRRAGATAASPRSVPRTTEEARPTNGAERRELTAQLLRELDSAQQ